MVDSAGSSGRKVEYLGQEYDHVFDVDIEDGKPPLKLPYNLSQNPYEAATKFIGDNELPISYLDQVANFITSNTQGATLGQEAQSSGPDAWGSDQRYRPGDAAATLSVPAAPTKQLPHKSYLSITTAAIPKIQKKIEELNQAIQASGKGDVSLNPDEISTLRALCKHLDSSTTPVTSTNIPNGLPVVIKIVTDWPYTNRMPGLDLLRLLITSPETATFKSGLKSIIDILKTGSTQSQSEPAENHVMMAVRGLANLFASAEGRKVALEHFEQVQTFLTFSLSASKNRNLLIAATTVYINYAVLFNTDKENTNLEYVLAVLETLGKILNVAVDSEVVFRGLVALGTVLEVSEESKAAGRDVYELGKSIDAALAKAGEPRNKTIAREVREALN